MTAYKIPTGTTPSDVLLTNGNNDSNIQELLSMETVTTNQPSLQLNTTNTIHRQNPTISYIESHEYVTRRQQARRRRRQRQKQRRREQREELQRQQEEQPTQLQQQQEERRQQEQQRQLQRRHKNQQRYEQLQERRQKEEQKRKHQQRERQEQRQKRFNIMRQHFNLFKQRIFQSYNNNFLNARQLEDMYALEWFQIREANDRETFPSRQQFKLLKHEIEQLRQIDTVQKLKEEEEEKERHHEELIQLQECELLELSYRQT